MKEVDKKMIEKYQMLIGRILLALAIIIASMNLSNAIVSCGDSICHGYLSIGTHILDAAVQLDD